MRAVAALAAALALALAAAPLHAQEEAGGAAPAKRTEGRYFIELAEIMLTPHEFDMALGTISNGGVVEQIEADMSQPEAEAPQLTLGLNRPSGKTQLLFSVLDFDRRADRIPPNDDVEGQIATTTLLPPGIVFRRQRNLPNGNIVDDYVPNFATDFGYIRRVDFKTGAFQIHHNIKEWESFRLRWIGGLRYAQIADRVAARMAFAKEPSIREQDIVQDFFSVAAEVETHGIGPTLGLDGRLLLGKAKKWSLDARGEISMIPESTSANYALSLNDAFYERVEEVIDPGPPPIINISEGLREGSPVMPGVPWSRDGFAALVSQQDFVEPTFLAMGQAGVRYKASNFFTVGLDVWASQWSNLLSLDGMLDTVHEEARYEQVAGVPTNNPDLRDTESVIHLPRLDRRHDVSFTGISLNLRFDF